MRPEGRRLLELFTGRDKAAAEAAQIRWGTFADRIELACVAAATPSVMLGTVAQAVEAGLVAVMVGGRRLSRASARIVADPPRADFSRRTHLEVRPLDTRYFVGSEIDEAGGELASDLVMSAAQLSALTRAGERALGAVEAGHAGHARDRLHEASLFAMGAADTLHAAAEREQILTLRLDGRLEEPSESSWDRRRTDRAALDLSELLPDDTLARLFQAGIRIDDLRRRVDRPWTGAPSAWPPMAPNFESADIAWQLRELAERLTAEASWL